MDQLDLFNLDKKPDIKIISEKNKDWRGNSNSIYKLIIIFKNLIFIINPYINVP